LADADRLARSKLIAYLARRFTAEDFPRFSSLLALLDEPAILRPNLRPCANQDHGRRWASYSEQHLGSGFGASAASITRRLLALSPSSCWGAEASSDKLRAGARCTSCGGKGSTLQHPGRAGNHIGFCPFPTSNADETREGNIGGLH
jgi:hypothetical protein